MGADKANSERTIDSKVIRFIDTTKTSENYWVDRGQRHIRATRAQILEIHHVFSS